MGRCCRSPAGGARGTLPLNPARGESNLNLWQRWLRDRPARLAASWVGLVGVLLAADAATAGEVQWRPAPLFGGSVIAVELAESSPRTLYALTDRGDLYQTTDGAVTWSLREGRRFSVTASLAIDPADAETLVAADVAKDGGCCTLLRTTDGGRTWRHLGFSTSVRAVRFEPVRPHQLYGYGSGIVRSLGGGPTWTPVGFVGLPVYSLAIDPFDGQTLLAAVGGNQIGTPVVVWRSSDQGLSWSSTAVTAPPRGKTLAIPQVVFDPARRNWAYAFQTSQTDGSSPTPSPGPVYRSQDGGRSWIQLSAATGVIDLAPAADGRLYAASSFLGVSRSNDAGETWTPPLSEPSAPADAISKVVVSPGRSVSIFAAGGLGIWKSDDRGARWDFSSQGFVSQDVTSLVTAGSTPSNVLALAGDSSDFDNFGLGIYSSNDRGRDWALLNAGRDTNDDPVRLLALDPGNPLIAYGAAPAGGCDTLTKSTDGGRTWRRLPSFPLASGCDPNSSGGISAFALQPSNPQTLLVSAGVNAYVCGAYFCPGWTAILRSDDGGASWTAFDSAFFWNSFAFAPSQSHLVYGLSGDQVYASPDGGRRWSALASGLPIGYQEPLVVDQQSPQSLYVGTPAGVFHSTDGGASFRHFGHRLDSMPIAALIVDPTDSANLYAGVAGQGVWRWDPALNDWTPLSSGLPAGGFSGALALDPGDPAVLYAGTIGRGLFQLLLRTH